MESRLIRRNVSRKRRVLRVRKKLNGTSDKPRMCVSKSNCTLYVQLIDDENGKTLLGVSSNSKEINAKKSRETAKKMGKFIGDKAKEMGILKIVFDRGRFKYHGLVAEIANAARESGLEF